MTVYSVRAFDENAKIPFGGYVFLIYAYPIQFHDRAVKFIRNRIFERFLVEKLSTISSPPPSKTSLQIASLHRDLYTLYRR